MAGFNPFAKRESHSNQAIWTYRVAATITWIVNVVANIYYTYGKPTDGHQYNDSIWGHNDLRVTAFSLNALIVSLYWLATFLLQIAYTWHLFSKKPEHVQAAAAVGSHFVFNNLLHFAFVMLFVRSHFGWAEAILIVNFFNLSMAYFRHSTAPRIIHIAATVGPLAWTFVALYWNGAIAVHAARDNLAARITANIAVWSFLVYGGFFLVAYKDYNMGFALSILTAALGVGQFFTKFIALQWIFAFTIMGVLFLATLGIAIPGIFGQEISFRREGAIVPADQERAPLLNDA